MKYADSIKVLKNNLWNNTKCKEIVKGCDEIIQNQEDIVDVVRAAIVDTENQILIWEKEQEETPNCDFQKEIILFQIISEFYRLNGRLALFELDMNTAYKHIFKVKTEYEYRFFARRIYTLLYECNDGLAVPVGKLLPKLKSVIDANCFDAYKKAHKKLCAFLATNHNELKRIRNQNEAHKTEEFDIQVKSIEDLKVSESINLIQEGNVLLFNLNAAFLIVHASLMKHLGEIMKKN